MDNILKLMDEYIKHEKIKELEEIKAEIQEEYKSNISNDTVSFAKVLYIIAKHISKLRDEE